MNVYLDTVNGGLDGWESFDYVLKDAGADKTVLYKFKGSGFDNEKVAECEYTVSGKVMQIKVKRADIGIADADFTVNFKVTDGVVLDNDIMNFYTSGDVAPAGRFKYSYTVKGKETVTTDTETEPSQTDTEAATETHTEIDRKNNDSTPVIIAVAAAVAVIAVIVVIVTVIKKKK